MYCRLDKFFFWSIWCSSLSANVLLVFILYFLGRLFYRAGDKWWNVGTRENKVHTSTWTSIATTDFGHHEFWSKLLSILLNKENWLDSRLYLLNQGWMIALYIETIFGLLISISFLPKVCKQKLSPQNTSSEGQSKRVWNEKPQGVRERQGEIQ